MTSTLAKKFRFRHKNIPKDDVDVSKISKTSQPQIIEFDNEVFSAHDEKVPPIPPLSKELASILDMNRYAKMNSSRYTLGASGRRKKTVKCSPKRINGFIGFKSYYGPYCKGSYNQCQISRIFSRVWANYDHQEIWDRYCTAYRRFRRTTGFAEWLRSVPKYGERNEAPSILGLAPPLPQGPLLPESLQYDISNARQGAVNASSNALVATGDALKWPFTPDIYTEGLDYGLLLEDFELMQQSTTVGVELQDSALIYHQLYDDSGICYGNGPTSNQFAFLTL